MFVAVLFLFNTVVNLVSVEPRLFHDVNTQHWGCAHCEEGWIIYVLILSAGDLSHQTLGLWACWQSRWEGGSIDRKPMKVWAGTVALTMTRVISCPSSVVRHIPAMLYIALLSATRWQVEQQPISSRSQDSTGRGTASKSGMLLVDKGTPWYPGMVFSSEIVLRGLFGRYPRWWMYRSRWQKPITTYDSYLKST